LIYNCSAYFEFTTGAKIPALFLRNRWSLWEPLWRREWRLRQCLMLWN